MEDYKEKLKKALKVKYEGEFRPFRKTKVKKEGETGTCVEESEIGQFKELGLETIRKGETALLILSGGLSTRMGGCHHKGLVEVTPVKKKCLLQVHLEKVKNLQKLAKAEKHPTVFILTSSFNHDLIESLLKSNAYFSLDPKSVVLLVQNNLPCFLADDLEYSRYPVSEMSKKKKEVNNCLKNGNFHEYWTGGFNLDENFKGMVTSPKGNGDLFETLHKNKKFMELLPKLKCLHLISVDNALSKPLDPEFVGLAAHMQSVDIWSKCVWRRPGENLGVFCVGEYPRIIEYSELDRLSEGSLDDYYFYGNMCEHTFSGTFLERFLEQKLYLKMPFHACKKRIPYWCKETNRFVFPDEPNGYKLELLLFDVMEFSSKVMCVIVNREESFAPLKTASDFDLSNQNAVQHKMDAVFKKWLAQVNCSVEGLCEISPELSYLGENLESYRDKVLKGPVYLT